MKKKSILFVADRPEWAYYNLIKTWGSGLKDFDCYVTFEEDFNIRAKNFAFSEKLITDFINLVKNNDKKFIIDSSSRFSYPKYKNPPVFEVNSGKPVNKLHFDVIFECAFYFQFMSVFPFTSDKKFVGIYTDSFPHEGPSFDEKTKIDLKKLSRKEFFDKYLKPYDGIIVGSSGLYNDYKGLTDKITFGNGIYLQDDFQENKTIGEQEGLTIGWTGNPNRSMKGFREVIEPAVEAVNKTGRKVTLKTKFSGPYKDLLTFYKDVDLIAIASEADTGPSLFAEASLSKVPAISTKIGFPKMIIEDGLNGIYVNRDIEEMKNAIIRLYDNRDLLKSFSARIKEDYLRILDNKISINNFQKLFS
ncbi:glycosyltransferase [Epilithonimonas sp.]|uniref:glycosyltransferase n=1 Tax=Epilithonimonas sp. TaxID=2894511 RepID=UPI0035AE4D18